MMEIYPKLQNILPKFLILTLMDLFGLFLVIPKLVLFLVSAILLLLGASSYHSGIDIPAPQGSKLIAVHDGEITFRQFLGAGGYTITLSFENYRISYCHCDPNFIVKVGDKIKQGQVIGNVGPRYVYGVKGNQYHDEEGKPTNGASTGPHLHLGIRIDGKYVNPLHYFI